MFSKDIFFKGFLVGLLINVVATGIVWILIEKIGISLIKNPMKLYLLAAIPAVLFMWYCIKKKVCMKSGMGTLLSVIVFVGMFFLLII
jgi:uncharacterized membrane protein YoaK (UPF0700 family)